MQKITLTIVLVSISLWGSGQKFDNNTCNFAITIVQNILPGNNWTVTYSISKKKIKAFGTKNFYLGDFKITRKKRLFSKKIKKQFVDSIIAKTDEIKLLDLSTSYYSGKLDGVNWIFDFNVNCTQKHIYLDNYYLPELAEILDLINNQIPKTKRYISFDFLFEKRI